MAAVVAIATVLMCVTAGLGFRRRFPGSGIMFYLAIASLVMPGLFVGLGISLIFQLLGWQTDWRESGIGAQLTWTLAIRSAGDVRGSCRQRESRQGDTG